MGTLLAVIRNLENSANFIGYAIRLGRDLMKVVHVYYIEEAYEYTLGQPPAPDDYTGEKQSRRMMNAERSLKTLVEKVLEELPGDALVESSADLGSPSELINDRIKSDLDDLVVLNGDEPANFILQNTSNDEVIDEITSPVLIVPENAVYTPFYRIVYASAFRERDVLALKFLVHHLSVLNPSIRVVHVEGKPTGEELGVMRFDELLQKETGYPDISVENLSEERRKSLVSQVKEFSSRIDADLIAFLREDRNFFEKIFTRDKAKEFLRASGLPVLVFKP
ncbi:MAG TPA: hypothetical protein VK155_16625 [Bacteroidales bacterium]|jgi:nucleotide-binding universal stress UspA family protein|nr:hypothetical protein [Bacteroidales bacterium]